MSEHDRTITRRSALTTGTPTPRGRAEDPELTA